MAEGRRYACTGCAHAIEAWDDRNPYYRDAAGAKRYAFHPHPDRARCTGVDSPMLCLACGVGSTSDSAAPLAACPRCRSATLVDTWALEGHACPYCRAGVFHADPEGFAIS